MIEESESPTKIRIKVPEPVAALDTNLTKISEAAINALASSKSKEEKKENEEDKKEDQKEEDEESVSETLSSS